MTDRRLMMLGLLATVLVLLTNRVHPGRERPVAGVRAAVASAL